jgi:hypothetical protein
MTYPHAYYQETVEEPFTGFAPTPEVVALLEARFLDLANANYGDGYLLSTPERVSSSLVTGQTFSMTFRVRVDIDVTKSDTTRNDQSESSGTEAVDSGSRGSAEAGKRSRRSS